MDMRLIYFHILLGVLAACVGKPSDGGESSTSTSVSVSTVTRKVTSRSYARFSHPGNESSRPVTEDMLKVQETGKDDPKPLKIKKKILASNLKNISEKVVFPGEKHDKVQPRPGTNGTDPTDGGKPNSSDSTEDETVEEAPGKSENATETVRISNEGAKKVSNPAEGRSFEDRSSEENVNVNTKTKTSTTVRTTSSYAYETFGEVQKVLSNNYLNTNEGFERGAGTRPPTPVIPPAKKPTPGRENSLKNTIRFESEYYGPTGQTDWVPIIPDKLPMRSPPGGGSHFGTKLPPTLAEKTNKTNEKNAILFPTEETPRVPTSTPVASVIATQSVRLPTKFRGGVKYRPSNSTREDVKLDNETAPKKNMSVEIPAVEVAPASSRPVKPTPTPDTTEVSVVSSTNHTTKSQDSGLVVPPENMKMENVTKEPQTKAHGQEEGKHNKTEITNSLPEIVDGAQGWIPIKVEKDGEGKNDTDVVVPGSVVGEQRNESTTMGMETTPEDLTTTETTPELTTLPKLWNATTENLEVSSQREETTEETVTLTEVFSKTPEYAETPTEVTTEPEPTTLSNFRQEPSERESIVPSTERTDQVKINETTPTTTTANTTTTQSSTVGSSENVTRIPVETTNPTPNATTTTPMPSTLSSTSSPPSGTTVTTPTVSSTETTTTTREKSEETKTTEEGIYYMNYIPTTMNPHVEITEENVPAYLRLTVQARDWEELCRLKEDLREAIIKMLGGKNVSAESVHFLNLNERNCQEKIEETKGDGHNGTVYLPVNMFLMDRKGDFDKNLSEAFLTLWGRRGLDFELPIRKVDFVTPIVNLTELADPPLGGSVVAAIVISCVAGICVILLGVLFVIMKRRQKRFNYGQRCTPVSLDAYSLDSVSIYNSVRRKDLRASKRSYGNAAFDDPEVPTHPMNFAGLANFSSDKEQLHEEFNIIPQVYPKVEELPAGAETKNRYANIIPLPETRVHLTLKDGDPLSYYINANFVRGLKGAEKVYIACQGPLESTVEDFWRMVWEQQCKVVLMLTDLQENGIEKCADYLPPNEVTDNLRLFGDFQVTLKKRDVKEKYIISHLKLKNMEANLWREVTHLWYLGWPDQGVPSEANSLIAFLIEARSQMKVQNGATTPSPVVVHCSPGTGRTGTVIACDLCIREYEQSRMVDIPRCVFNLRRDRAGAVQTKDQYAFIYQVLNVYATKLSGGGIESI